MSSCDGTPAPSSGLRPVELHLAQARDRLRRLPAGRRRAPPGRLHIVFGGQQRSILGFGDRVDKRVIVDAHPELDLIRRDRRAEAERAHHRSGIVVDKHGHGGDALLGVKLDRQRHKRGVHGPVRRDQLHLLARVLDRPAVEDRLAHILPALRLLGRVSVAGLSPLSDQPGKRQRGGEGGLCGNSRGVPWRTPHPVLLQASSPRRACYFCCRTR